jgi:glutathione S-transferase
MKLYYSPGACALGVQIALRDAGMQFQMVKVDLGKKTTTEGDYRAVNPKGYVPALLRDDGTLMTEAQVILQWISDQKPELNLLPKAGTAARYKALEWLNFIATEIHKSIGSLYNSYYSEEGKVKVIQRIHTRLAVLEEQLSKNPYLLGNDYSVCEPYLYNVLRWTKPTKIDMSQYKAILGYVEKLEQRPAYSAAVAAEKGRDEQ